MEGHDSVLLRAGISSRFYDFVVKERDLERQINALLREELMEARRLFTHLYNAGYMAGHNDTVENSFYDIHQCDMGTYNSDVVRDLVSEISKGMRL